MDRMSRYVFLVASNGKYLNIFAKAEFEKLSDLHRFLEHTDHSFIRVLERYPVGNGTRYRGALINIAQIVKVSRDDADFRPNTEEADAPLAPGMEDAPVAPVLHLPRNLGSSDGHVVMRFDCADNFGGFTIPISEKASA